MSLISIVMPIYNNELYLEEAIQSFLAQSRSEFEFIIIDDGSKDSSFEIANKYKTIDNRIKLFKHDYNRGVAEALKTGIKQAEGKYLFFAAGDDISLPNRLDRCIEVFESNSNIGVIITNAAIINQDGKETGQKWEIPENINENNYAIEAFRNTYCLGASMATRNNKNILLKQDMLKILEDYEIVLEFIVNDYDIFPLKEDLIQYRLHESNQSNKNLRPNKKAVVNKYATDEIFMALSKRNFDKEYINIILGCTLQMRNLYEESKHYIELAMRELTEKRVNDELLFQCYFYLGLAYFKCGDLKSSEWFFGQANRLKPEELSTLNNLAVVTIIYQKNRGKGIELLRKALSLFPNYLDAIANLNNMETTENISLVLTEVIMPHNARLVRVSSPKE